MVLVRKLRVYREVFTVVACLLLALLVLRRRAAEPTASATTEPPEPFAREAVMSAWPSGADASAEAPPPIVPPAPTGAASSGALTASASVRTSERLLVIGDSMVEVLAPSLAAYALENGHTFVPAIWYGSTTAAWARSPELAKLLREVDPTVVLVVLGSSELTSKGIESRRPFVRTIRDRVGARELAWIGPPNWRADSGINDLLSRELGADRFFRSADLELTRKRDGIHPDARGGRVWMDAIADWMGHESALGLPLRRPTRTAAAPPARVIGTM